MDYEATIYAANDIEDGGWREVHKHLVEVRQTQKIDTPIRLMIYGNGGNADTQDALLDLIDADGNIHGYLIGCAYSAHASLFAACQRRFVYPNSRLMVHETRFTVTDGYDIDEYWLRQKLAMLEKFNMRTARVMAKASNKSIDWWRQQLADAREDYTLITAHQMVNELDMAEFVS